MPLELPAVPFGAPPKSIPVPVPPPKSTLDPAPVPVAPVPVPGMGSEQTPKLQTPPPGQFTPMQGSTQSPPLQMVPAAHILLAQAVSTQRPSAAQVKPASQPRQSHLERHRPFSHTRTPPYPSQTDINFAAGWPGVEWLIVGLRRDGEPTVRSYRIDDGVVREVEVEIEVHSD